MTTEQVQHLLGFLGFDVGAADGVAGEMTRAAVRSFQAAYGGLDVDGSAGEDTQKALREAVGKGWTRPEGDFWAEIRFFRREEFRCRCGGKYCGGFPAEPREGLVREAEALRAHFGGAVIVTSGVRCQRHNKNVGGVANSRHLTGKAMDFRVAGHSAREVVAYLGKRKGIRYVYAIDGNHVHMDIA